MQLTFNFLEKDAIDEVMVFMVMINQKTPQDVLKQRMLEMFDQHYKCLGIYDRDQLIGICGLWFMTRHYCGKSIEPDHVIVHPDYQSKGVGNLLFEWIFQYAKDLGYDATELNTYVENPRSHKFYYNLGYEIKGFHFVKLLD